MIHALKVLWTAFKIGWENESNWTWRPVYFLYAAVRPFALCLILYFVFRAATDNPSADPNFMSVYIGNAFFTIFIAISSGIAWVIIEDREWLRVIKYIFIAPMRFSLYILGRAALVMSVSILSTIVIILFGLFALKLPITAEQMRWGYLLASFALGLASSASLGMMFAGAVMLTARHSTLLAEGIGGAFLLLCGVIYPLDFMPAALQKIAMGLPLTYWMEATRRGFGLPPFGQAMAGWSNGGILIALVGFAVLFMALAVVVFKACTHAAVKRGKLDQITHY